MIDLLTNVDWSQLHSLLNGVDAQDAYQYLVDRLARRATLGSNGLIDTERDQRKLDRIQQLVSKHLVRRKKPKQ